MKEKNEPIIFSKEILSSPIFEAYKLLGAHTPLELNRKYTIEDQKLFLSHTWDYEDPNQIINKIKNILESSPQNESSQEENDWRQETLWFWYHHAISVALWKKDISKAREFSKKALELLPKDNSNKITKLLDLLVNGRVDEAKKAHFNN